MRSISVVLAISIMAATNILAAQEIPIRNGIGRPIFVWSQPEKPKQWQPELYVGREGIETLSIPYPGQYWIVIGDENRRGIVKGWVDLHAELRDDPLTVLVIDSAFLSKTYEKTVRERRNGRWFNRRVPYTVTQEQFFLKFEHPPPR